MNYCSHTSLVALHRPAGVAPASSQRLAATPSIFFPGWEPSGPVTARSRVGLRCTLLPREDAHRDGVGFISQFFSGVGAMWGRAETLIFSGERPVWGARNILAQPPSTRGAWARLRGADGPGRRPGRGLRVGGFPLWRSGNGSPAGRKRVGVRARALG